VEDFMRSVVFAASLLAGSLFATSQAAAQDPETPPPPPAQERVAGSRRASDAAPRQSESQVRVRDAERAPDSNRTPEGSLRRPTRETVSTPGEAATTPRTEPIGAVRREPPAPAANASLTTGSGAADDQRRGSVRSPQDERDRAGRPLDYAIPRSHSPAPYTTTVLRNYPYYRYPNYARYYDPWGYGSFGLGYFFYAPWVWSANYGYGYPGYYPVYSGPWGSDIGSVKLKVRQRDAEVWVDGYYAGTVDDFDGTFQALKLDSGPYRIEIRKPGFPPLAFDVRVQPGRTITFRGDMIAVP
jgi:hypothetical protein